MTWRIVILVVLLVFVGLATYAYRVASFISGGIPKKWKLDMPHVPQVLDGLPCDIYFFASWGSYSHPIFPTRELTYAEALKSNHYRAWLYTEGGATRFMLFEGVRLERTPYAGMAPALVGEQAEAFFTLQADEPGESIRAEAALVADQRFPNPRFLHVRRGDDGVPISETVSVASTIRYRYFYDGAGKAIKAEITNFDGEVSTYALGP